MGNYLFLPKFFYTLNNQIKDWDPVDIQKFYLKIKQQKKP